MKNFSTYIASAILYFVWFLIAYALTVIVRAGTITSLSGENIEALAVTLVYVAPFDFLLVTITLLPIIFILFREYILRTRINLLILGIVVGIVFGTLIAALPFSPAWKLMLITSIF